MQIYSPNYIKRSCFLSSADKPYMPYKVESEVLYHLKSTSSERTYTTLGELQHAKAHVT